MKTKQKVKARKVSRPVRRSTSRAIVPAAPAAPVVYRSGRALALNREQVDLIRRLCAKDANNDEFALFMQICKKSKLDPFKKEIYCIIWPTKGGTSHEMVLVTGIGGYRTMAARDHKDYDGSGDGGFTWFDPPRYTPAGKEIPRTASVTVYAKGSTHGTTATVRWEEYAPKDLTKDRSDFWNRMPCNQLEKCAEAKALRKRFPGLNNIFIDTELDQRAQDFTEGNRQINMGGTAPSGKILDERGRQQPEQLSQREQAIANLKAAGRWCEKHQCPKMKCPVDEHTQAENDEAYEAERRFHRGPAQPQAAKPPIDVKPKNVRPGQRVGEPVGGQTARRTQEAKASAKAPKKESGSASPSGRENRMADAELLAGALSKVVHSKARTGAPMLNCCINDIWYSCFRKSIFEWLTEGQFVKVYIDRKTKQLVGLNKIKGTEFENDGKTPKALDVNREAGTRPIQERIWPREPGED